MQELALDNVVVNDQAIVYLVLLLSRQTVRFMIIITVLNVYITGGEMVLTHEPDLRFILQQLLAQVLISHGVLVTVYRANKWLKRTVKPYVARSTRRIASIDCFALRALRCRSAYFFKISAINPIKICSIPLFNPRRDTITFNRV